MLIAPGVVGELNASACSTNASSVVTELSMSALHANGVTPHTSLQLCNGVPQRQCGWSGCEGGGGDGGEVIGADGGAPPHESFFGHAITLLYANRLVF